MLLTTAYSAMGAIGVLAYLPQLRKLLNDPGRSEHMPLLTWSLWGVQNVVVFTYGVCVNHDLAFIAVNFFSMLACNSCLGLILYNRFFKRLAQQPVYEAANVITLATHRQVA